MFRSRSFWMRFWTLSQQVFIDASTLLLPPP